jgi:hypothetical protein
VLLPPALAASSLHTEAMGAVFAGEAALRRVFAGRGGGA